MRHRRDDKRRVPGRAARVGLTLAAAGLTAPLGGCHWDSFIDPSVVGRWEETPTIVPILDRIAALEDDSGEFTDFTEISEADLRVEVEEYRITPGDILTLTVWDIPILDQAQVYARTVDQNGYVQVPPFDRVFVGGLTEAEVAQELRRQMRRFVDDPLASVVVEQRRAQTYNVTGAIATPGTYAIPSNDYRLLEAVIAAGGLDAGRTPHLFVIRQVALGADATTNRREFGGPERPRPVREPEPAEGEEVIDIIDDILGDPGVSPGVASDVSPGAFGGGRAAPVGLAALGVQPAAEEPPIDLLDEPGRGPEGGPPAAPGDGGSRWVFIDGQWVRTAPGQAAPVGAAGPGGEAEPLVTQRIIRVPVDKLMVGDATVNIIVRPGDVIRVPLPAQGQVYIGGQIGRPGVYVLPPSGRLTLTRLITAAGELGPAAIPERIDLTRMVGPDRQGTVLVNLRAINEGTQPDLFLKPDDRINVGTNFWALPLAVIRNGFRASYGFGFVLDRNFEEDVFGDDSGGPGG